MKKLTMILTLALLLAAVPLMAQTAATSDQPEDKTSQEDIQTTPSPDEGQGAEPAPPVDPTAPN